MKVPNGDKGDKWSGYPPPIPPATRLIRGLLLCPLEPSSYLLAFLRRWDFPDVPGNGECILVKWSQEDDKFSPSVFHLATLGADLQLILDICCVMQSRNVFGVEEISSF